MFKNAPLQFQDFAKKALLLCLHFVKNQKQFFLYKLKPVRQKIIKTLKFSETYREFRDSMIMLKVIIEQFVSILQSIL